MEKKHSIGGHLFGVLLTAVKSAIGFPMGSCRFEPSCSEYAKEAISTVNPARAVVLILWRVLRCNPLCRGGIDPVPKH